MSKLQILLFLGLVFFSFIYLYTAPSDLDDLDSIISELVDDTKRGSEIIDKLETRLENVDNVEIFTNVSYSAFKKFGTVKKFCPTRLYLNFAI